MFGVLVYGGSCLLSIAQDLKDANNQNGMWVCCCHGGALGECDKTTDSKKVYVDAWTLTGNWHHEAPVRACEGR